MSPSRFLVATVMLAVQLLYAEAAGRAIGENLVPNPGFEEVVDGVVSGWAVRAPVYSISSDRPHTGKHCLRFENHDAQKYVLTSTKVEVDDARRYEIRAWVRTEEIVGNDTGAAVCLEFWGPEKKYLSGTYVKGIKGSNDWTEIRAVSKSVPKGTETISLTCYVRRGMTGVAYWDDVSLRRFIPPLAEGISTDCYRNETTGGPVSVSVGISLDGTKSTLADLRGVLEIIDSKGKVVQKVAPKNVAEKEVDFVLDSTSLAVGDYQLRCRFDLATDPATGEVAVPLHRVAEPTKRRVYIDKYQRTIVDGKPFFPLGMYWGSIKRKRLETYADSAFNCLMPYGRPKLEQMEWLEELNLMVMFSIKDYYAGSAYCPKHIKNADDEYAAIKGFVEKYSKHPALLAWYVNDERPKSMVDSLEAHQQWIEDLDPDHPTWTVLCRPHEIRAEIKSYDIIGTDPYPIPTKSAGMALGWVRQTRSATFGKRAAWQVPQVFDWRSYRKTPEDLKKYHRAPTLLEMRSMSWQSIAGGANGLVYYSWFDLWRMNKVDPFEERWGEVKLMAAEVGKMIPVLLSVDPVPEMEAEAPEGVAWRLYCKDGETYLVAVNSSEEAAQATFRFAAPFAKLAHEIGSGGTALAGRELKISFTKLEPKVIRLTP